MPEELNIPDDEPLNLEEEILPAAKPEEEESISLVEPSGGIKPTAMRTFGSKASSLDQKVNLKRQPNADGKGAIRCRVFYSKIAVSSLQHMENQINEWLDAGNYEVKQVAQVIGVMEGKTAEPNLIVTVWY